jgi:hypothetical protein
MDVLSCCLHVCIVVYGAVYVWSNCIAITIVIVIVVVIIAMIVVFVTSGTS